jgi:hypothetical protein
MMTEEYSGVPDAPDIFEEAPKKNNKTLYIILAVVAVIIVCCCLITVLSGTLFTLPEVLNF